MNEHFPNVVLIMTDDQGWGDIHDHSNNLIDTPVLGQLRNEGARFNRFFVSPVCAPTRASLLTGRYYLRTGVHGVTRGYETMRSQEETLAEILKSSGYATGCFGKWHNGAHYPHHPNGQGFDEFTGFCAGHWNNYFDTTLDHNGTMIQTQGYITDVLTDRALQFIELNQNNPFFCYIPYNAPHSPWQVPDKYFNKYKQKGLTDKLACAYGMVENVDESIGRILSRLDVLGLAENTIVIFLTDNGPNSDRYNGDMRGRKGSVHEGGVRIPCFIRWPGTIEPGTRVKHIAADIDILPTIVDLAGIPVSPSNALDGVSLKPLLLGEHTDWEHEDRMLFTFRDDAGNGEPGAVRNQRWRAVCDGGGEWELFDMVADPGEREDVAIQYPDVLDQLVAAYEAIVEDTTSRGFAVIPVEIGHSERPEVMLPAHEAFLYPENGDGISYQGSAGWANDWVTNWSDTDAYPYWEVDIQKSGPYAFTLMYVCSEENVGAEVAVQIGEQTLQEHIEQAHDPEPVPSPDRVPRNEVYEKTWTPLQLGQLELNEGRQQVKVKVLRKPGDQVMDLKAIQVTSI